MDITANMQMPSLPLWIIGGEIYGHLSVV
jgi:hypothetical protein